jgi:hypothetical protein
MVDESMLGQKARNELENEDVDVKEADLRCGRSGVGIRKLF